MKNTRKRGWIGAAVVFAALSSAPALALFEAPPAANETCDQATRDQADQRYRDAKLNLKEAQLAKDTEGIRLRERELEAARVEFCKCLRSIFLATGQKPDNYDDICYPRGKYLIEPPREGQRGTDRQEGPVICGLERMEFQDAEKAWNDAGKPLDFEPGSVAQRYSDARKALCECLKKRYGSKMSKRDRELCKDPSDSWTPVDKKPNASPPPPPPPPPVQIDPDSANPPGTESGPAPQGENPQQPPGQPRRNPQPPPPAPDPNTPAPPGPGMPAPPGPGMPAADCLREGAWSLQFTVESHANNHNHEDCVKFLRRVLKAIFGNFAGDLFSAKFEDLLPEMQCTKLPGCSGTCKGTLPQFAGKENVEFEIPDVRRNGDTLTGKLIITSGGERLFVLRFTATPAVAP